MDVLEDLWDNKPLLITVVVAVLAVVFMLHGAMAAKSGVSAPTSSGDGTSTVPGGGGYGGTYIEESYENYHPTTVTPGPSGSAFTPSIVKPAAKGSLGSKGAGKKDTNFWVYTVPSGATLTSLAQFARWGSDYSKLANYRNNADILKAAGVDINNPYATVPSGLQLSV